MGTAALVAAGRSVSSARGAEAAEAEFHLALLSDTHIPTDPAEAYRGFKPVENLQRIVPEMIAVKPEAVIHCGDLARLEGKTTDYEAAKGLLAPLAAVAPVYLMLGNHDDRENFRKAMGPAKGAVPEVSDRQVLVVEHAVARMVLLDSLMFPNKTPGHLGKAQRDWLAKFLAKNTDRPVVLFVHHTLGDADGELLDVDRFFALIQPHRHVKAIFYGHSHVWERKERAGIQLINLPAVGYNFGEKEPVGWVDARFRATGVELTLRAFGGNRAEDGKKFEVRWS